MFIFWNPHTSYSLTDKLCIQATLTSPSKWLSYAAIRPKSLIEVDNWLALSTVFQSKWPMIKSCQPLLSWVLPYLSHLRLLNRCSPLTRTWVNLRGKRSGARSRGRIKSTLRPTDWTSYWLARTVIYPFPRPATPSIMCVSTSNWGHLLAIPVERASLNVAIAIGTWPSRSARDDRSAMPLAKSGAS